MPICILFASEHWRFLLLGVVTQQSSIQSYSTLGFLYRPLCPLSLQHPLQFYDVLPHLFHYPLQSPPFIHFRTFALQSPQYFLIVVDIVK